MGYGNRFVARSGTRTRKYRQDPLVHHVIEHLTRGEKNLFIVCTGHWVGRTQINLTDEPIMCVRCLASIQTYQRQYPKGL